VKIKFAHMVEDLVEAATAKNPMRDWVNRNPSVRATTRRGNQSIVLLMIGSASAIPTSAYLGVQRHGLWFLPCGVLLLLAGLILWSFVGRWTGRQARREFAADQHTADPVTVEVNELGLHLMATHFECHVDWSAILCFYETPHLMIFIDDTPETLIVPRRAFADAATEDAFCRIVREHINERAVAKPEREDAG
jgi:hypothetical protein